jgi:thioesterase domain-containing protein
VYGLQARDYTNLHHHSSTLEALASDYLSLIREIQPKGPYLLLGWSFGGMVAFELARQIESAGESVGLLAILDSYPNTSQDTSEPLSQRSASEFLLLALGYDPATLTSRGLSMNYSGIARILKEDGHMPNIGLDIIEELLPIYAKQFIINSELQSAFLPTGKIRAEITLFIATETHSSYKDTVQRWEPYVSGRLEAYNVATKHNDMMDPISLASIGPLIADKLKKLKSGR